MWLVGSVLVRTGLEVQGSSEKRLVNFHRLRNQLAPNASGSWLVEMLKASMESSRSEVLST